MQPLPAEFGIPADLLTFVANGFLQPLRVDHAAHTLEFHIPSLISTDWHGYITSCSVHWIHPDHRGCVGPFGYEPGGDVPNFLVETDTSDVGGEIVDDLNTIDDLLAWLAEMSDFSLRQQVVAPDKLQALP